MNQRFLFLDALRGIAALYVALFHFYSILKEKTQFSFPALIDMILLEGAVGVQIFFVLSGFVIAYSIYRQNITLEFLTRFFIRRSVRLDPPYWIAILLTLLASSFSVVFFTKPIDDLPSFRDIAANLFYLQDFLQMERIIHVSWTLCLEIQLYLFFVAFTGLLLWMQKIGKMKEKGFNSFIFLLAFGSLFLFSLAQNLKFSYFQPMPGLFTPYWYNFFIGCLLCWVHLKAVRLRYYWLSCACMIFSLLIAFNKQVSEALLISLIIYGVSAKGRLHDLLAFQPFQYLGKISYSLYLTHWLFAGKLLDALARRFSDQIDPIAGVALLGLCLMVALITAHFFYQWIEFSSMRWSRQLKATPAVVRNDLRTLT